jgi:hypothetical protein
MASQERAQLSAMQRATGTVPMKRRRGPADRYIAQGDKLGGNSKDEIQKNLAAVLAQAYSGPSPGAADPFSVSR